MKKDNLFNADKFDYIHSDLSQLDTSKIVKGYDFNQGVDYSKLFQSFICMGIQGSQLGKAIELVNKMLNEKDKEGNRCKIFLGVCTSVISSGARDMVRYLCEHNLIDVIVMTGGGVDADIMKSLAPNYIGEFNEKIEQLDEADMTCQGNMLTPKKNLELYKKFLDPLIDEMYEKEEKENYNWTPSKIISFMGERLNKKDSICYWANQNKIPIYSPAITDGQLAKKCNPKIDVVEDIRNLNGNTIKMKLTGQIILGGGIIKHHILNSNLFRNGAEYTVIINTGQEFDGSDSGAKPTEAITWGKIRIDGEFVKINSEVTLILPILISETFYKYQKKIKQQFQ